jgi:prepilin-type N-terminal cleavage/methylation domain-containing protein
MNQKAFTLLEITVVVAIIGLLAAIVLANYRGGERQSALLRSAHSLAQDLRRVEEMAISSQKTSPEFGEEVFPRGGYGIYFEIDPEAPKGYRIILFADCDQEADYDDWGPYSCAEATSGLGNSRDEAIETIALEEGVEIKTLFPISPLAITFIPPDPEVKIAGGDEILAVITLCLKDDPTITRTVTVNKAGLID